MLLKKSIIITVFLASTTFAFPYYSKPEQKLAPLLSAEDAETIPESYIVVFKDHVDVDAAEKHHTWLKRYHEDNNIWDGDIASGIKHTYDFGKFKAYSGRFRDDVLDRIRSSDEIAYVERDQMVYVTELQKNAPWGLSRISHRQALTFGTFNKYPYDGRGGDGITVYIIDTGININHVDFEGRALWGSTIPDGDEDIDGNGHGTHVAGTVAGKRYGVAKKANVVAVKVLRSNGSGTMSDVLKGVEWALDAHTEAEDKAKKERKPFKGSAANMSLGGGRSNALDTAVNTAVEGGIHFAVAAGNDNRDACDYSPAAAEKAVTVGASTVEDERAWFSNYGKCVDVFAPGKDITSTWIGSKVATNTISGTSMASPHVAGLLAYFLSLQPTEDSSYYTGPVSPKQLKDYVIKISTKDALEKIPRDTKNYLVYNNAPKAFFDEFNWKN